MTAQWKRSTLTEEDADGIPYVGAQAWFYNPGTTTPRAVYSDSGLAVPIAQPVTTAANGKWPQVFVQNGIYRYILRDAAGNLLLDEDQVDPGLGSSGTGALPVASGGTGATTAAAARSNLGAAAQADVNAINVTLANLATVDAGLDTRIDATEADIAALESALQTVPDVTGGFRQGIHAAPVGATGVNSMFPATSGTLSISTTGLSADTPLVASCGKGYTSTGALERFGFATTALTWSGLTPATTNFLYVDIDADGTMTPGSTVIAPIYKRGGTPSASLGQFTYQIDRGKCYVGDGVTAVEANRCFIGEAVTDGSSVTQAFGYALRGRSAITATSNLPGLNASQVCVHNLGTDQVDVEWTIECVSPEGPYSVGDIAFPITIASAVTFPFRYATARNSVTLWTGASVAFSIIGSAGARLDPTAANWRLRPVVTRNF